MADQVAEPVAVLTNRSGTVAPQYQWSSTTSIFVDGRITMEDCRGSASGPPRCSLTTGTAPDGAVAAIIDAALAADLFDQPAATDPHPPVGGGTTSGRVTANGRTADLPAFPAEADQGRVRSVMEAISAAVGPELRRP